MYQQSFWRTNWRWLRIGIIISVILVGWGILCGWWREDAGVAGISKTMVGSGVEVPNKSKPRKLVALTFDDGPSASTTPVLLDVLKKERVHVTFFTLGTRAQKNTDIIKREAAEGHEVGVHTMTHANLTKLAGSQIKAEVDGSKNAITGILGYSPKLLRPPYGSYNNKVLANISMPIILWTVDTLDWKKLNAEEVKTWAVQEAFDGAIILFHDIYPTTVEAIKGIVPELKKQGYELVTVSQMAEKRGVKINTGFGYGSFRP